MVGNHVSYRAISNKICTSREPGVNCAASTSLATASA